METPSGHSVDYELLGKYLARECSAEETERVEFWLQDEANAREFSILQAMWDQADPEPALVDVDQGWAHVSGHMRSSESGVRSSFVGGAGETAGKSNASGTVRPFSFLRVLPYVAAGIAILVVVFFSLRTGPDQPLMVDFANAESVPVSKTLPDGSTVRLKPGSALRYAENFGKQDRNLELKGEAFFEVEPDAERPFVIGVAGTEVRVLGTSFNVNPGNGVEVKVATGKVQLSAPEAKGTQSVVLEAGESARFDSTEKNIVDLGQVDENDFFWVNGRLDYRETPLKDIAKDLKKHFKIRIRFGLDLLKECKFTGTFEDASIDSILLILTETFNLTVTQDGNKYLLEGTGC